MVILSLEVLSSGCCCQLDRVCPAHSVPSKLGEDWAAERSGGAPREVVAQCKGRRELADGGCRGLKGGRKGGVSALWGRKRGREWADLPQL